MSNFDWRVDPTMEWPPRGRPKRPYGPTAIEILRSCALRLRFERSSGYQRRMTFEGRIGIAFHKVLESIGRTPPSGNGPEISKAVRSRFASELAHQEVLANERPRERGLPRSTARSHRALEALLVVAQQLAGRTVVVGRGRGGMGATENNLPTPKLSHAEDSGLTGPDVEVEVPVDGYDGTLNGRVDRIEHTPMGPHLFDYKSSLRSDVPERYERQVQLYAALWHQTRGSWPAQATLVYPLVGTSHVVDVTPAACESAVSSAIQLIETTESEQPAIALATPGDVCQVCEFRPWCQPFWQWQRTETSSSAAFVKSKLGFEGIVRSIDQVDHHWKVTIAWRDATVTVVAPVERLPHVARVAHGTQLRILDARLQGLRHAPRAVVGDYTEAFIVTPSTDGVKH